MTHEQEVRGADPPYSPNSACNLASISSISADSTNPGSCSPVITYLLENNLEISGPQVVLVVKNLHVSAGDKTDVDSIPGLGRSPRTWYPTPLFLPGESHGQRSLVGCSP